MFKKTILKGKINRCKRDIAVIEQKRIRSQSALVQAILTKETPDDADVDYFNLYTSRIDELRREMAEYEVQMTRLD